MTGEFQTWTPEEVKVADVSAAKQDVLRVERLQPGGGSRGKHAAIGAVIGFGGGFAVGAALGRCKGSQFGPCISRGELGAAIGGAGQ